MIDTHCHILPVDDGAKDMEESIKMARVAQKDGIKKIINTTHFNPEFEYPKGKILLDKISELNDILKKENIDIEVFPGNELYYNEALIKDIEKNNIEFYTLNNSKYILLEFSPSRFPKKLDEVVYEFSIKGYKVILAHVERYKELQEEPEIIDKAIQEGAYVQVNVSSVLKKGPKIVNSLCEKLLKEGKVHIVASDAHGFDKRRPMLKDGYEYIKNEYGEENAKILFIKNPSNILEDEELLDMEEVKKKSFLARLFSKRS